MNSLDQRDRVAPSRASSANSIEMRNLVKTYGSARALDDVSIDIPEGSFAAILGPSGSGKTTLLNALGGFADLDSGTVTVNGVDVTRTPSNARGLGYVFQQYALFPHLSIAENIAFPLASRRVPKAQIKQRVADALALVELEQVGHRSPAELSGGQQQRIALARALVYEPPVLLLDEPLAALDRRLRESLQDELRQLHARVGSTFLLVTHDQEEAMSMADLIVVMRSGQVEQMGTPAEVYDHPATTFVASFLGDCNLVAGRLDADRAFRHHSGAVLSSAAGTGTLGGGSAVIRPEMLRLVADGQDLMADETGVDARVEHQRFMGREILLSCSSALGTLTARIQRIRGNLHAESAAAPGQTIRLAWRHADIHCIADPGDREPEETS